MDDALLGANRAVAKDDGVEIGSNAKAHALTVTAAFVRSQLIHHRLGSLESNSQKVGRPFSRMPGLRLGRALACSSSISHPSLGSEYVWLEKYLYCAWSKSSRNMKLRNYPLTGSIKSCSLLQVGDATG